MKLKRLISSLLLVIYLMAAGGSALVSLSCKCVAINVETVHVCCHHCQHTASDAPAVKDMLKAPCCGDHHSTEIELYTSSTPDSGERFIRCAITDLPPTLMVKAPAVACISLCGEALTERHAPFIIRGHVRCAGLRAPPVLA